eukprot:4571716-Karenia_brevis.AAC.1
MLSTPAAGAVADTDEADNGVDVDMAVALAMPHSTAASMNMVVNAATACGSWIVEVVILACKILLNWAKSSGLAIIGVVIVCVGAAVGT